jgi:hypothetical protein
MMDAITTDVSTSGLLKIYDNTGGVPADVGVAIGTQKLLAQLALSPTFAAAASGGVLTANSITPDSSADDTGTAAFFRLTTSGGTAIVQGSVGTSGTDLNLNTVSIQSGATVSVTSFVITEGNA